MAFRGRNLPAILQNLNISYNSTQLISRFACSNLRESKCSK